MLSPRNKTSKKGFTLIELLVVISIISLLASIVLAAVDSATRQAEGVAIAQEVKDVVYAVKLYHDDNGYYPTPPDKGYYCLTSTDPVSIGCASEYDPDLTNQLKPYFDLTTLFNSTLNKYGGLIYFCGGFDPSSGYCDIPKMFYIISGNSCVVNGALNETGNGTATLCLYDFEIAKNDY